MIVAAPGKSEPLKCGRENGLAGRFNSRDALGKAVRPSWEIHPGLSTPEFPFSQRPTKVAHSRGVQGYLSKLEYGHPG